MNNIPIEFLAKILSVNYINVSISDTTEKQPKKHSAEFHNKLKYVINQSKRDQFSVNDFEHSRNILIIGNGASFPFTKNTKAIAKNIEDEILKKHQPYSKTEWLTNFKNEWRSIVEKIERKNVSFENSSTVSFETRMAALIKYLDKGKMVGDKIGTEEVLFQLKKHVNHKYLPSLFYELTAHLFKYRFIDVIINFNFDELLDNAIEDELEERSYLRIVHDSDIRGFNHICDLNRLKTPIYIKPHGTYSPRWAKSLTKARATADLALHPAGKDRI